MKIGIIGYGKMGQAVERVAQQQGIETVLIGGSSKQPFKVERLSSCDVVVEFTRPDAVINNLMICLKQGVPVVTGTTGWHHAYDTVKGSFLSQKGSLFSASNFSIGMNIAFELNRQLANWMSNKKEYIPGIHEVHHLQKIDKPSGTAVTLANEIISSNSNIQDWELTDQPDRVNSNTLPIQSERLEGVIGIHHVTWTSSIDRISICHEAFNRDGFALGALNAAIWLIGKKGVYTMRDLLFGINQ